MIMILFVPTVVLVTAAAFYLYSSVLRLLAKTAVRHKVVLITDSLSALGNECAKVFHRGGARLILCGKGWEKLEALAEQLASDSDPTLTFPPKLVLLDFSDMESLEDVISEVLECYGCLDVLVVNSSTKIKAPVQSLSLHMDRSLMDMNYFGPITLVKGVLPCMISRRTGHILLVNSIQGKLAVPFRTSCDHTFVCGRPPFCVLSSETNPKVIHNRHEQCFTISFNDTGNTDSAVLRYKLMGNGEVDLLSTLVPESFRSKGVAVHLAKAAMDFVVEEKLKAHISCWYIKKYVEENPIPVYKNHIVD